LTAYTDRTDAPHFARLVPNDKIAENSYNLSVSTYVEQEDKREAVDITALNAELERIVSQVFRSAGARGWPTARPAGVARCLRSGVCHTTRETSLAG
jgi:hypothetical protein